MQTQVPDVSRTSDTDIQNILLLNVLKKNAGHNKHAYDKLINNEMYYLNRALVLLEKHGIVAEKYGGYNLAAANKLSREIRALSKKIEAEVFVKDAAEQAVIHRYRDLDLGHVLNGTSFEKLQKQLGNDMLVGTKFELRKDGKQEIPSGPKNNSSGSGDSTDSNND